MKTWEISLASVIFTLLAVFVGWSIWFYLTIPYANCKEFDPYNQTTNTITIKTRNISPELLDTVKIIIITDHKIIIEK